MVAKRRKKIRKEEFLQIRVTEKEKTKILDAARQSGFDTLSAYMLWLARRKPVHK